LSVPSATSTPFLLIAGKTVERRRIALCGEAGFAWACTQLHFKTDRPPPFGIELFFKASRTFMQLVIPSLQLREFSITRGEKVFQSGVVVQNVTEAAKLHSLTIRTANHE
jgi:hypothetical protein